MDSDVQSEFQSPPPVAAFHDDDGDPAVEYGSLSVLAVIAFVLGIASPLCFIGPLLMVVPLAGVAVAVLALGRITISNGALVGRWLAIAGLAASVGCATAAISRDLVLKSIRADQAADFGVEWIKMLQSESVEPAFRLTINGAQPRPVMPTPGEPPPTKTPLEQFRDNPLIKSIVGSGSDATVECAETLSTVATSATTHVRQRFTIVPPTGGQAQSADGKSQSAPLDVILTLQRAKLNHEIGSRWLVVSFEEPSDNM